jgi:hypothetical protein
MIEKIKFEIGKLLLKSLTRINTKEFTEEKHLRDFLGELNLPEPLEFIIEHEKEHYNCALKLGYNPFFVVCYNKNRFILSGVRCNDNVRLEDKLKILYAPKILSEGDKKIINKLEKQIK